MKPSIRLASAAAALCTVLQHGTSTAQSVAPPLRPMPLAPASGPTEVTLGLNGWFPAISGQTTFVRAPNGGDFNVDISDLLSNLEFTFQGTIDVREGHWGLLTDLFYTSLGNSKSGVREATVGGVPIPVGAAANTVLDVNTWLVTVAGYYRAVDSHDLTTDVLFGLRYADIEQSLNWSVSGNVGPIPLPGRAGTARAEVTNWDAIVGVRGRLRLDPNGRWFVPFYADLGAGDSRLTWQLMGGVGYTFSWGEVTASWRYLSYDLGSSGPITDLSLNGPMIGASFRW